MNGGDDEHYGSASVAELRKKTLAAAHGQMAGVLEFARVPAIIVDRDHRVSAFTTPAGALLGMTVADVGRSLSELTPWHDDDALGTDVDAALASSSPRESQIETPDGRILLMRVAPMWGGGSGGAGEAGEAPVPDAVVITFADGTGTPYAERSLLDLVAGTSAVTGEQFFPALARHLAEALGVRFAVIGRIVHDEPHRSRTLAQWIDDAWPDNVEYALDGTPCGRTVEAGEYYCAANARARFPEDEILVDLGVESYMGARMTDDAGEVIGHLCVFDDKPILDEQRARAILRIFAERAAAELVRKRAAERQALMTRELDHRVKNTLATVIAISQQTLRSSTSVTEFGDAFLGRIHSLALVHEALARRRWDGASIRDLIERTVAPYRPGKAEQIRLCGEDLLLPVRAVPSVGLTLHELATNAAKYGALSTGDGGVDVYWETTPAGERRRVMLVWQERGGPPVQEPERRGVGSELIEGGIRHELDGFVEFTFLPFGLRCAMEFVV